MSVRDDGPGIDSELLPRAFDRFVKEPGSTGSGLGLAICRDLVEAQGGHISIDSVVGKGTTVSFALPMADRPGRRQSTPEQTPYPRARPPILTP